MQRFFGTKKPEVPAPTLQDAGKVLDERGEALESRIAKLDRELLGYKKQLKTAQGATKNAIRNRAVQALKRKKMLEKQRDSLMQQSFNVEQQAFAIESLKGTSSTILAMKEGAKTLKTQYKSINMNELEDLQDDMADMLMDAEEINDVVSRAYGLPDDVDEADLDAELAGLDEDLEFHVTEEDELPDYLKASEMPSAPAGVPVPGHVPTALPAGGGAAAAKRAVES